MTAARLSIGIGLRRQSPQSGLKKLAAASYQFSHLESLQPAGVERQQAV